MQRRHWLRLAGLAVALIILALLVWYIGWREFLDTLRHVDARYVAAAGILYALLWLLKGAKWRWLLAADGIAIGLAATTGILIAANTLNILLPAKLGDLLRGALVNRRTGARFVRVMVISVIDRLLDLYGVLGVAALCLPLVVVDHTPGWVTPVLWTSAAVGLAAGIVILASPAVLTRAAHRLPARWANGLEEAVAGPLQALRRRPLVLLAVLGCAVLVWSLEAVTTVLVARAVGIHPAWALVGLAVMLANLTKVIPLTPGGLGTYEATLAAVLALDGTPAAPALAVAVLDHAVKNVGTLLPGVVALTRYGWALPELGAQGAEPGQSQVPPP